jgi:hypothetical protein
MGGGEGNVVEWLGRVMPVIILRSSKTGLKTSKSFRHDKTEETVALINRHQKVNTAL